MEEKYNCFDNFFINAVKYLRNTTNTNIFQDDNAGSIEMHCNPAINFMQKL